MKVKLKSSGEIVDVEKKGEYYIDRLSNVYREDEVEVQPTEDEINDIEEEKERLYWRDVRKEILIELIRAKGILHDVTINELVTEADLYVKLLKVKDR